MKSVFLGACGLALAAAGANATTFSFASDANHQNWTFAGLGALISAAGANNPQVLLVDDDNGPLPALTFNVEFRASMQLAHSASVPVGGGNFLHVYGVAAVPEGPAGFGFFNADGSPLLVATFSTATFRAAGPQGAWGSAANLSASDLTGSVTYTWFGPDMPAYGLYQGQSSVGMDDAAFTFTNINSDSGAGVPLGDGSMPSQAWASEGSYSGTAHFVPAPGAVALMGLASVCVSRRRR